MRRAEDPTSKGRERRGEEKQEEKSGVGGIRGRKKGWKGKAKTNEKGKGMGEWVNGENVDRAT